MGRHCCVSGCSTGVNLPSHTFPKDETMMNKWKKAVYSENIRDLSNEQLRKCVVCYRHFADNDYEATYRLRRLKPGVIPSLYLPDNGNNNSEVDNSNNNTEVTIKESEMMNANTAVEMEEIEIIEIIEEDESAVKVSQSTISPTNKDPPKSPLTNNITENVSDERVVLYEKHFHKFTPKMWKLYKLSCVLKKKQEIFLKRQLSFRQRISHVKQYSKSPAIEKLLSSLTPVEQAFLQMQIKATGYTPKDKYFTLDEKIAALSIMKQSSKSYQYLSQVFNLPSMRTLESILHKVNIHPGPINFVNQRLKKQVKLMKERDKVCFLMWDEMLLQLHVDYDATKRNILGFEDCGKRKRARFADHALVFMVRGVQSGWKLPLAYYFYDGAIKTDQLIEWIKDIAKIIIDSGLYLVAFICNDEKKNITAINKLKLDSARLKSKQGQLYYGYITINSQDIIPLYDPSHLIKSVCNNLLNNDLEFDCMEGEERKFASWEIIEQAYHMDLTHNVYRLMPKITAEHIIKNKVKRKVKNAIQVLSMTMGAFIHHHTKLEGCVNTIHGPLKMPEKKGRDTAEIILFFDRLFDSVNGHTLKPEKPLRVAVSHNSPHFSFWERAIKRLRRMRFVDTTDRNQLKDSTILKNWISTIQGFRKLWIILKKTYEFKHLKPRILNHDSLRHFFKQIRSFDIRNADPTCAEFENSFKTLFINNLTLPRIMENNMENKVDGSLLFTLKEFVYKLEKKYNDGSSKDAHMLDVEMETMFLEETYNCQNICNTIAVKILGNSRIKGCDTCKNLLTDTTKYELVSSNNLLETFKNADNILTQRMGNVCYSHHTALMLETELYMQMDLHWLNCQQHDVPLKEFLISYIVVFYIYKWCNGINDIFLEKENENSL